MTVEQRERLTGVVERLRQERDECGRLPRGRVQLLAPTVGIGVSTLYRYIDHGVPQPQSRPRWTWGEHEKAVLMALGGDVTATRDWLIAEHGDAAGVPDIRWMQATKHRDLAPDEIVLNEEGIAAANQLRIVLRLESARRNELWLADHKQLDVWVIPPRGKPVKPWVTMIVDAKSRKAPGAALSTRPSQAHVLAAMQQAIEQCGVPETLLFDLGMEFTANALACVASDLVFVALPTRGYHPNHKGKVERLVQTIGRRAVRMLPQRTHQALDLRKGPRITVKGPDGTNIEAIHFDDFVPVFFDALQEYNARHHKTLRASPNAVYAQDATPERKVSPQSLRRFMLKEGRRAIGDHGIRFNNDWYYDPAIDGHRRETTVEFRYRQDDRTKIEVYRDDGAGWCTARLTDPASPAAHEQVLAHRRERAKQTAKTTRKARKVAKRNYEAVTERSQQVRETTVITNADVEREVRAPGSRQAAAMRELGLDTEIPSAGAPPRPATELHLIKGDGDGTALSEPPRSTTRQDAVLATGPPSDAGDRRGESDRVDHGPPGDGQELPAVKRRA
jgi:putative transposase